MERFEIVTGNPNKTGKCKCEWIKKGKCKQCTACDSCEYYVESIEYLINNKNIITE